MARWTYRRRDAAMLEVRRREAADLLERGVRPAEVARTFAVSRTAVHVWGELLRHWGPEGLRAVPRRGRPVRWTPRLARRVARLLERSPREEGFRTEFWSLTLLVEAVRMDRGLPRSRSGMWKLLRRLGYAWQRPLPPLRGLPRPRRRRGAGPGVEGTPLRRWYRIPPLDPRGRKGHPPVPAVGSSFRAGSPRPVRLMSARASGRRGRNR